MQEPQQSALGIQGSPACKVTLNINHSRTPLSDFQCMRTEHTRKPCMQGDPRQTPLLESTVRIHCQTPLSDSNVTLVRLVRLAGKGLD